MRWLFVFFLLAFASSAQSREVSFSWEPMEGASEYELQLSGIEDFTKPFITQKLQTPTFTSTLDPGKYFYRVRVIDQAKHPGKWSNIEPVIVASVGPELIKPAAGFETSYYEHLPEIEFTWKPTDLTAVYEIVIRDSTGTDVFHTTQDKTTYKNNFPAGEYTWQIRSMGKSPIPGRTPSFGDIPSDFSKSRNFKVTKNDLTKPILKTPLDKAKLMNHDSTFFSWTQDPHSHFADLNIESLDGEKTGSLKFDKIKDTSIKKTIEKSGRYRWSITSKEEATTPGVTSEYREFTVVDDPLFAGNYELELNSSYGTDTYLTNSSLQTYLPGQINQQSFSAGMHYGLSAGYYVFRSLGFFVSAREFPGTIENLGVNQKELDGQLRLRYGANGFFQEFWFGYRQMDIIEAENNPTSQAIDLVTTGPLFGTRLSAEVTSRFKIQATGFYYKPINYTSPQLAVVGPLTADVMGGSPWCEMEF